MALLHATCGTVCMAAIFGKFNIKHFDRLLPSAFIDSQTGTEIKVCIRVSVTFDIWHMDVEILNDLTVIFV